MHFALTSKGLCRYISKAARRKWAWVLALVMIVSIVIPTSLLTAKADVGTVKFIDGAAGWLE